MWVESKPNERKFITYTGQLPTNLYRYRSLSPDTFERTVEFELIEEAVYLAALKDLNDPDEGRFIVQFSGTDEDILNYCRQAASTTENITDPVYLEAKSKKLLEEVKRASYMAPDHVIQYMRYVQSHILRVASFTTNPVNYSMWANYAKFVDDKGHSIDHGGICIEYRCDEGWRSETLHPVNYSDAIPVINPVDRDEGKLVATLYAKAMEWHSEAEWRLAYVLQTMPPFGKNFDVNAKIKLEGSVTGIIFGINTPQTAATEIIRRVSSVRPGLSYRRVVVNPVTYVRKLMDIENIV